MNLFSIFKFTIDCVNAFRNAAADLLLPVVFPEFYIGEISALGCSRLSLKCIRDAKQSIKNKWDSRVKDQLAKAHNAIMKQKHEEARTQEILRKAWKYDNEPRIETLIQPIYNDHRTFIENIHIAPTINLDQFNGDVDDYISYMFHLTTIPPNERTNALLYIQDPTLRHMAHSIVEELGDGWVPPQHSTVAAIIFIMLLCIIILLLLCICSMLCCRRRTSRTKKTRTDRHNHSYKKKMVGEGAQSERKKEKAVRPGTPKVEEDNVEEQDDKKGDVGKSDVANEKDNVENSNFADKNVRKDTVKADVEDEEASSPPNDAADVEPQDNEQQDEQAQEGPGIPDTVVAKPPKNPFVVGYPTRHTVRRTANAREKRRLLSST